MLIAVGIITLLVGFYFIGDEQGTLGTVLFFVGIVLLIIGVSKNKKKKQNKSNYSPPPTPKKQPSGSGRSSSQSNNTHYQDDVGLERTSTGYQLVLKLRSANNNKSLTCHVFLSFVASIYGEVKDLPICTTNPKYWKNSKFDFVFFKEGTGSDLNNFRLDIKTDELVRPTKLTPTVSQGFVSKYIAFVLVEEQGTERKIIEKMEILDITIRKCLEDQEQSFIYGVQRFIELAYILSKVDGDYTSKERTIITTFIETNTVNREHANLKSFLRQLENRGVRSFNALIAEIKGSIGAMQLVTNGMELLVGLSVSDGEIEAKEEAHIKQFAKSFGFSDQDYQKLISRYVLKNNDFVLSLKLFGITEDMTAAEKKRLLNKAYAEWNRKIISSNPEMKQRAQNVIEYISLERLKL